MDKINKLFALFFAALFLTLPAVNAIPSSAFNYSEWAEAKKLKIDWYNAGSKETDYAEKWLANSNVQFYSAEEYRQEYLYFKTILGENHGVTQYFKRYADSGFDYYQQTKTYYESLMKREASKEGIEDFWTSSRWKCDQFPLGGVCTKIVSSQNDSILSLRSGDGKKHYFPHIAFFYVYKRNPLNGRTEFYKYWGVAQTPNCLFIKDMTQRYGEDLDMCYKVTKEDVLKTLAIAVVVGTAVSYYTSIALDFTTNIA